MNQISLKSNKAHLSKVISSIGLFLAMAFFLSSSGMARPLLDEGGKADLWSVSSYSDASPTHEPYTQFKICIKYTGVRGTHWRYKWWSPTDPGWRGKGTQEGDQVMMHGFWEPDLHSAWYLEVDTAHGKNLRLKASGHWWIWLTKEANYQHYANVTLERTGINGCDEVVQPEPDDQEIDPNNQEMLPDILDESH